MGRASVTALIRATALLWLAAGTAAATPVERGLVCRLDQRCDGSGCAAQHLTVEVMGLPKAGDGTAIVDFGDAERGRPVTVMRRDRFVLMIAPNGPDGGRFSLRISGDGGALLSHASTLDGGITRTGHCDGDRQAEAGT